MRKILGSVSAIVILCMMFVSCSTADTPPDIVFECSDFYGENKAYYSVSENTLSKITATRYNDLTGGSDPDYEKVDEISTYLFDVNMKGAEPSEWTYDPAEGDPEYDIQILISELEGLDITFTGKVFINIYEFDGYKTIRIVSQENSDSSSWLLCDEKIVDNPDDLELNLVRGAYRPK